MTARVGLIGVGHVGTSVAISLLQSGAVRELLLHDRDNARAEGEAMDLAHGAPFYPRATVRAAGLDEVAACDVVVFAAGRTLNWCTGAARRSAVSRCAAGQAGPNNAVACAFTLTCSAHAGLQAGIAQRARRTRLETPVSPPALSLKGRGGQTKRPTRPATRLGFCSLSLQGRGLG